jgi:CHASE3 domain sensor protein
VSDSVYAFPHILDPMEPEEAQPMFDKWQEALHLPRAALLLTTFVILLVAVAVALVGWLS